MFAILSAAMLIITMASTLINLPLGEFLTRVQPGLLNLIQSIVQGHLGLRVWEEVFVPFLMLRVWVVPGFLTVLFAMATAVAWIRPPGRASSVTTLS